MTKHVAQAQQSIAVLRAMLSTGQWEPIRKDLEFAIREVSKCIPTKPIRETWKPNRCPCCNADLGGDCEDGYYDNPFFSMCPECRQVLNYD